MVAGVSPDPFTADPPLPRAARVERDVHLPPPPPRLAANETHSPQPVVRPTPIERVWTGGQTGADQGALRGAQAAGVRVGGWAPKGYRTEDGPAPWLATWGLKAHASADYPERTRANVRETGGTVIVGDPSSPGSQCALDACQLYGKPSLVLRWTPERGPDPSPAAIEAVRAFAIRHRIRVMHFAGNRESRAPGIGEATMRLVLGVLS